MFKFDSPIFDILGKIVDILILSTLWVVMSIPIVTIGASTTAAYYVAFNQLNKRDGYVISSFFKSFKENFRQATIIFIILATIGSVSIFNLYAVGVLGILETNILLKNIIISAQILVLIELSILSLYAFSLNSKITFTLKELFITSMILGHKHLFITILNGLLIVGIYFAIAYFTIVVMFSGAIYIMGSAFLMKIVITKYRSDIFDSELEEEEQKKLYK